MDEFSDGDLLARWSSGDRDAFAVLVSRHHGMVQAACRRQAAPGDADDCTQAVFVILSRRPAAAARAPVLAAWLQRTAWFVCRHARRSARRRQEHERLAATIPDERTAPPSEALDHLDGCLLKLPEKQRAAVTLHYLAGKTADEVAASLGTNRAHAYLLISRGLAGLRVLLARRGVAVAGAGLASLLATQAQAAATSSSTAIIAALATTPSTGVATLATGAMTSMTIATITPFAVAAGLLLTIGATTVVVTAEPTPVAPQEPPPVVAPLPPAPAKESPPPAAAQTPEPPKPAPANAERLKVAWNGMDTQYTAEDLARQILADRWLAAFVAKNQRNPKLSAGRIVVRAGGERIETGVLMDKLTRGLLASGKVVIIEPDDQADRKGGGAGTTASPGDVVLNGSIVSEQTTEAVTLYTVTITGKEAATSEVLFSVESRIRKEISQARWK